MSVNLTVSQTVVDSVTSTSSQTHDRDTVADLRRRPSAPSSCSASARWRSRRRGSAPGARWRRWAAP